MKRSSTVAGRGLSPLHPGAFLEDGKLVWRDGPTERLEESVLRPVARPFSAEGGLRLMQGNLGRGVMKVSAVAPEHQVVEAPALVFEDQLELVEAFKAGKLERDFVAVVRFQGPRSNGMPELHKMTPYLGVLQDRGFKVALVTDGRMSGASGKIPAAIHVCPEAFDGGPLARVRDGDLIRVDGHDGETAAAGRRGRVRLARAGRAACTSQSAAGAVVRLHAPQLQHGGAGRRCLYREPPVAGLRQAPVARIASRLLARRRQGLQSRSS